jgi:hypothetical protein
MTNVVWFLAMLIGALVFGAWVSHRVALAQQSCSGMLSTHRRNVEINDAADLSTDGEERTWWL